MNLVKKKNINVEVFLLCLAIVLTPFNSIPYMKNIFGELSMEGAFYALLVLLIVYSFKMIVKGKIYLIRDKAFSILFIYLAWIIISCIFNYDCIISNFTKGRTGIEKYLFQTFVYMFGLISTNLVYFIMKSKKVSLYDIRRYILYSFFVVAVYSFFEILKLNNIEVGNIVINKIDSIIRNKDIASGAYERLRSVSGEASWFCMYAAFIFPWIFSYLFEKKYKILKYFMILYFFIMIYYTKSRTGYFIIAIEIFLILIFIFNTKNRKNIAKAFIISLAGFIFVVMLFRFANIGNELSQVFTSFSDKNNSYNLSNIGRLGSQKAAIKMGIDRPILGVGFGQYGFNMPNYIDSKALSLSWELQVWADCKEGTPWAPVHALYPRIIGETGFVGILIWIYFFICVLSRGRRLVKKDKNIVTVSLMISFIGILLAFLNLDSFRFFPFWIMVGIIINQLKQNNL